MNTPDIVSLWKSSRLRDDWAANHPEALSEHPAGVSFLTDAELRTIVGALPPKCTCSPSAITSITTHPSCPDCV